jgi:hypothetical protein
VSAVGESDWHKYYAEEFESAEMLAFGAIVGWMYGKGEVPPKMTANLRDAMRRGLAEAFNAGVDTANAGGL